MSGFHFDAVAHKYYLGDRLLPSVTEVCRPLYDFSEIKPEVLQYAAERGTAVHLACELHDRGSLDRKSIDPAIAGYVAAWISYRADVDCEWDIIEQPMHHPRLLYAGTPDRIGTVDGKRAVIDIKTTSVMSPAVGVQLAGYQMMEPVDASKAQNVLRVAVQLRKDGTYRTHQFDSRGDSMTFLSLLNIHNWRLKNAA